MLGPGSVPACFRLVDIPEGISGFVGLPARYLAWPIIGEGSEISENGQKRKYRVARGPKVAGLTTLALDVTFLLDFAVTLLLGWVTFPLLRTVTLLLCTSY